MTPASSAERYLAEIRVLQDRLVATQAGAIEAAGRLVGDAVAAGGVIHAFGTGHTQAFAMELVGRAGGLVATSTMSMLDVGLESLTERDPEAAPRLLATAGPELSDAFVIASQSGVNGAVVELAVLVKQRGHPLIAVTSFRHSEAVPSRHPSGLRLRDLADIAIDNGAPIGDAVVALPGGGAACAVSSITAGLAAQLMVAYAVDRLLALGVVPPVYMSANVPGGDERNRTLEARYGGRLRRLPL